MNNVHIIPEPVGLMRKIARDALRGHWKQVFAAVFIYAILTDFIASILNMVFPNFETIEIYGQSLTINRSFVGTLYTTVLVGAFTYGMTLYLLTFFRTKKTDNSLLFEGFSMPGKTILLQIVMSVRIFLWSLLLVVPGIIAAFRYSMAYYILADHPEYTINQCIEESKARMTGNKMTLFVLYLSFIGWAILASLASEGLATMFGTSTVGRLIGLLVGSIPNVLLAVYTKTSETVFYELLTGNLVVMVPDQGVRAQGVDPDNMVNADYQVHDENDANNVYSANNAYNANNGYTANNVEHGSSYNANNGPSAQSGAYYGNPGQYDYRSVNDDNVQAEAYASQAAEEVNKVYEETEAYAGAKAEDIANDAMKAAEDALKELRNAAGAGPIEADAAGAEAEAEVNADAEPEVKPAFRDEVDEFGGPKDEPDEL